MLSKDDPAPDIAASNQNGNIIEPNFTTPTVVYFYPRDGTPGCQLEAQQFQDNLAAFEDAGVTVYGASTDTVESHAEFAEEEGITFGLLADPDGIIANKFGLEVEDNYVDRVTFVLEDDKVKDVIQADAKNPDGHADEVLATTQKLVT